MSASPHTVGAPTPNIEAHAFDLLVDHAGVEICDACRRSVLQCRSIREAFKRLKRRGVVECVKAQGTWLYFVVRDAVRPIDQRGLWRKS